MAAGFMILLEIEIVLVLVNKKRLEGWKSEYEEKKWKIGIYDENMERNEKLKP